VVEEVLRLGLMREVEVGHVVVPMADVERQKQVLVAPLELV
jgi:hypothetical protein